MPDTPVNMPMGRSQIFMFAFTPTAPVDPIDMPVSFRCANTDPAEIHPGVNTLLISACATPVPDMVAMVATLGNHGIVNIPGTRAATTSARRSGPGAFP